MTSKIIIAGQSFEANAKAYVILQNYIKKLHKVTEMPYETFVADMEESCRDLLLSKTNQGKKVVNESLANEALELLKIDEPKKPSFWGNVRLKFIQLRLLLPRTSYLIMFFITLIFAIVLFGLVTYNDGSQYAGQESDGEIYYPVSLNGLVTTILIGLAVCAFSFITSVLNFRAWRNGTKRKAAKIANILLIITIPCTIFGFYMCSMLTFIQENNKFLEQPLAHVNVCGDRIQTMIGGYKRESAILYGLQDRGYKLAKAVKYTTAPVQNYGDNICPEYYELRKAHKAEDIIIMDIEMNGKGDPLPRTHYLTDDAAPTTVDVYVGLFVR
jgi:hypothetical protein